jgi:hypothetical protein
MLKVHGRNKESEMKKYPNINARAILKRHNRWRRGAEIPIEDPKTLGDAIELLCMEHAEMEKALKYVAHNGLSAWQNQSVAMERLDKINKRKGKIK